MFQVYLVGGIVRDKLMGVQSHDRDYVVVGATEADMLAQGFKKVGADFPVFLNKDGDQYALARTERKTGSGYQGFSVVFDASVTLEEDLSRRDLTINAMAEDLSTGKIVDPFNARSDLRNRVLRHVGSAFGEDPLRVVRLARFYARWADFTVAPETLVLCATMVASGELNALSDERLWVELEKLFKQSAKPERFFQLLEQLGAFDKVDFFKDLLGSPAPEMSLGARAVASLEDLDKLAIFVALVARDSAPLAAVAIPVRAKSLVRNIRAVRALDPTAKSVVEFMNATRAFEPKCVHFADVLSAMQAGEAGGFSFPVSSEQLLVSHEAARGIKAADFISQGMKGAEIGRAMCAARIAAVESVFGQ
jgi:tRNA nucleotidyltransferase/poly(A) polymerase